MHIVWFKRDLRIHDHACLVLAAQSGPVLPLYIFESELWQQPDMSLRHYNFLIESLQELEEELRKIGLILVVKVGFAVDVLEQIYRHHPIQGLWSHQETGNKWTYERDKAVKSWCQSKKIQWNEPVQNGVIRRLKDRDGWAAKWYKFMNEPVIPSPKPFSMQCVYEPSDTLPKLSTLNFETIPVDQQQKGGRSRGIELLDSFLYRRGEEYTKEMSSPITAVKSCSRISAHLAFGTLSVHEVFRICEKRHREICEMPYTLRGKWPSAIRSFIARLRWHCHFIQKLEDEPAIEFQNMHPSYNGMRENEFNERYFEAWKSGKTGFPMVDACMRALIATGWIKFRMRAMLISFASHHLWLQWRRPALYLAQLFTDYEPGIHYSQVQMQSGTTGINTIRIYNPIKQGFDQDPEGEFIKTWIPELRRMHPLFIHTPWEFALDMGGIRCRS
jgi:deoxyribodipyrimidine photo-lyase